MRENAQAKAARLAGSGRGWRLSPRSCIALPGGGMEKCVSPRRSRTLPLPGKNTGAPNRQVSPLNHLKCPGVAPMRKEWNR